MFDQEIAKLYNDYFLRTAIILYEVVVSFSYKKIIHKNC
jgi:hypothetical protein